MWTLSGGCISRELEKFLLWELPVKRGWIYYHAALVSKGVKTVASHNLVLQENERFQQLVNART